tara:strand:+ start:66 stop:320 length:255 start_codon:yes stop_codon:yes gene_type:complete
MGESNGVDTMLNMSIEELKERMGNLRHLQNELMELNHYISAVKDLCVRLSIECRHSAVIEYGRIECDVNDALVEIENRLMGMAE